MQTSSIPVNKIIGFRRDSATGRPVAFTQDSAPRPRVVDGGWNRTATAGALLRRLYVPADPRHPATRTLRDSAPDLLGLIRSAQGAKTDSEFASIQDQFCDVADGWMEAYRRGVRDTVADSTLYALLAPVFAMPEVIERVYSMPQLFNLLPKMTLGTVLEVGQYLEYEDLFPAVASTWTYDPAQMAGMSGTMTPRTIPLKPFAAAATVTGRERELHEEMRGKQGAPSWDLFARKIQKASEAVIKRAGQVVAYGDTVLGIPGLIDSTNGVTAVNANFASGTGLTDYATIAAQIDLQAAQVNYEDEFTADTIMMDQVSFRALTKELISNTGDSGDSVLSRIFLNAPEIESIVGVRELGPIAAEIAEETPKVGAPEAALLGGGYLNGGTYHRCMVLTRAREDVQAVIEGLPLSIEALDPQDGADRSIVRMSTGGCKIFRTSVPRIVYI